MRMSLIFFSPTLMFHPPSLLFPDGHFETTFPTLTSTTFLPSFTCPKNARQAHSLTSTEEFGYLAKSSPLSGYEPKKPDTTPIKDPDHDNTSDFSKSTRESTGLFGVSTVFEAFVSHVSRCQGKVDGTVLGVILFRLTENSFLMDEISENALNEELNKLFLVKNHFKEDCWEIVWHHCRLPPMEHVSRVAADLREEARQAHEEDRKQRTTTSQTWLRIDFKAACNWCKEFDNKKFVMV